MKNFRMLGMFSLSIILFISSCSKEIRLEPEKGFTEDEKLRFHHISMVNSLALGVIDLSQQVEFRNIIHTKVKEKFDRDYNVLFKNINETYPLLEEIKKSISSNAEQLHVNERNGFSDIYNHYMADESINAAINGYQMKDEIWYSQIYIPFINEVELTTTPTIVVGIEDGGDCVALGYEPQSDGTYKIVYVDEGYAKSNLVWVVSVNERVDNNGLLFSEKNNLAPDDNRGNTNIQRTTFFHARFSEVKVSDKKECWLCGDAEVSIVWAHIEDNNNCIFDSDAYNLKDFAEVGKDELDEWTAPVSATASFFADENNSPAFDDDESVVWVMYEYDKNHGNVNATFPTFCPSVTRTLQYKSKQSYYGKWGANKPWAFDGYDVYNDTKYNDFTYNNEAVRVASYEGIQ
ncbi:MAG: hypothetical protein ACPGXZ_00915 [Saprospiraceae bacterium]